MTRKARLVLAAGLVLACTAAGACGYCIEDRVAAAYDHHVVEGAGPKRLTVAFFSVDGESADDEPTRRALLAALHSAGGNKGSARVALPSSACSVAFDASKVSLDRLTARANKALSSRGMVLAPLRVIAPGGKLAAP